MSYNAIPLSSCILLCIPHTDCNEEKMKFPHIDNGAFYMALTSFQSAILQLECNASNTQHIINMNEY